MAVKSVLMALLLSKSRIADTSRFRASSSMTGCRDGSKNDGSGEKSMVARPCRCFFGRSRSRSSRMWCTSIRRVAEVRRGSSSAIESARQLKTSISTLKTRSRSEQLRRGMQFMVCSSRWSTAGRILLTVDASVLPRTAVGKFEFVERLGSHRDAVSGSRRRHVPTIFHADRIDEVLVQMV